MSNTVLSAARIFYSGVPNPLPVCFPFAGRVWAQGIEGQYHLSGEIFKMPIHGFLHKQALCPDFSRSGLQVFSFSETSETLAMYPFYFDFTATWTVAANKVRGDFKVTFKTSTDANRFTKMPVAFGLHPYFNISLEEECFVNIQAKNFRQVTADGNADDQLNSFESKPLSTHSKMTQSLIFENLYAHAIILQKPLQKIKITFGPEKEFRYVVVWRPHGAEFQCIEPWACLPDAIHRGQQCLWLEKGGTKNWWFEVEQSDDEKS